MLGGFPKKIVNNFLVKREIKNFNYKISLNGRSSLFMILVKLKPEKIYLPFYICDSVLNVLKTLKLNYSFYKVNKYLKPQNLKILKKNEYAIVVPYFGINYIASKKNYIYDLSNSYFYPKKKINLYFNSIRKFFNVNFGSNLTQSYFIDENKLKSNMFKVPKNYSTFKKNENNHFVFLGDVSKKINKSFYKLNFIKIKKKREKNFFHYHGILKFFNKINIIDKHVIGPLYYPFHISNGTALRKFLNDKKIYNPCLWKDVTKRKNYKLYCWERKLTNDTVFLPVDENLSKHDIFMILQIIKKSKLCKNLYI